MPLIANPATVENERKRVVYRVDRSTLTNRDAAPLTIGGEEPTRPEQPSGSGCNALRPRPLKGLQGRVVGIAQLGAGRDVEVAATGVLEPRQSGVFAKDIRRRLEWKLPGESQTTGDLGHHPPIRLGLARRWQKGALPGNAPFGVGDRAVLLAPGQGRQFDMGQTHGVGVGHRIGDDDQRTALQRGPHLISIGHADHRVGAHDPQRLDLTGRHRLEQLDRF